MMEQCKEKLNIEAFKNVKTDKKLVIAGGSSDTDSFMNELKDLAKDDDRIIFTGFVQGQILKELYSNRLCKRSKTRRKLFSIKEYQPTAARTFR